MTGDTPISTRFSPIVSAKQRRLPGFSWLGYVDVDELGVSGSPVVVLDDFRVAALPFSPHPHAGFAAVTYVFEDSAGALRSRASSGADLLIGPGGIVWTEAGSGLVHEEIPAELGRELHGLQVFVNRSLRNRLTAPGVLYLEAGQVPEWRNDSGDRVRVVVGSFNGVSSPLVPVEPFNLLDIDLRRDVTVAVPTGHNAIVYVRTASVFVRAEGERVEVHSAQAVAVLGGGAPVTIEATQPAQVTVLAGAEIREPMVAEGAFIMNTRSQIEDANRRYRQGAMGSLTPLS